MQGRASRHGVKAKAGRQGMARQDKAVVAKQAGAEADRHRPCSKTGWQVKLAGTGLVAKTGRQLKLAGTGLVAKTGRQVKLAGAQAL